MLRVGWDISKFNSVHSSYHRQAKKLINELLSEVDIENSPNIPSNIRIKFQWYMAECIYSAEHFNKILGLKSTSEDRHIYLVSGALLGMSDLIIDDVEMPRERLTEFKRPKQQEEYQIDVERLYAYLYHHFFSLLDEEVGARTKAYYELLFDAQVRSKRQFDADVTLEEVDQICKDKCGYSVLYIRAMVRADISPQEEKCWYEQGALVQFCNDAQDLYKDAVKGLRTFGTVRPDIETISKDLQKQMEVAAQVLAEQDFREDAKRELAFIIHAMVLGIQAKLNKYSLMCKGEYSLGKLASMQKSKVRRKLSVPMLVPYVLPRLFRYRYKHT